MALPQHTKRVHTQSNFVSYRIYSQARGWAVVNDESIFLWACQIWSCQLIICYVLLGPQNLEQCTLTDSEMAHNNEPRPSGLNLAEKSQSQP